MTRALSLLQSLTGLSCVMLFHLLVTDIEAFAPAQYQSRSLLRRMMMAASSGSDDPTTAFKEWLGSDNTNVIVSSADSPAGVLASYWNSVSSNAEDTVVVAPSSGENWTPDQIDMVNGLLGSTCSAFDKLYHPNSANAELQSPYFALRHADASSSPMTSSSIENNIGALPGREEVMEGVMNWFQNQLLNLESEIDFIDLGRKLLTVQDVVVSDATTKANFLAACWSEAAKLSVPGATVKPNGEEQSILIIAASLDDEDFVGFMETYFSKPLSKLTKAGMGKGEKLNLFSWGAEEGLKYPMVLIHPNLVELEAPEDAKVMTFTELLQSCTEEEEDNKQ